MANKTIAKKLRMGYELRINQSGQSGEDKWSRVGGLFTSTQEAADYRARRYPNVSKFVIMGIKVTALPKIKERFMYVSEKTETKKGAKNAS